MATIDSGKIIWDYTDWLAGLHPQYDGSNNPILFSGLKNSTSFNPFRNLGYASVGELAVNATNVAVATALLKEIIYVDGGDAFAVGGTLLHAFNPSTNTLTDSAAYPHAVSGSTMDDVIEYKVGTAKFVFYSWYDSTDGDVGQLTYTGPTFDDDFMSTVPASGAVLKKDVSHPMIVGDDDILYIGNGNVLASFDGQTGENGTFRPISLTLPTQYQIKSFAKLSNRTLVIFASTNETVTDYVGSVKAYFWDYVSADPYEIYDIFGGKAGGAFNYKNSIGVFTSGLTIDPGGAARIVHLSLFNGSRFERIASFKGVAPIKGGVEVIGDTIYANIAGTVFMIDNPFQGVTSGPQKIAVSGGTSSGLLRTIKSGTRLISSGTTTNGGLQYFAGAYGTGTATTTYASPVFNEDKKGQLTKIRIEFDKAVTGGRSFSLYLYDRDGSEIGSVTGVTVVTADKTIIERNITPSKNFDALQLKLQWDTGGGSTTSPIVKRVIAYYKETKTLI